MYHSAEIAGVPVYLQHCTLSTPTQDEFSLE